MGQLMCESFIFTRSTLIVRFIIVLGQFNPIIIFRLKNSLASHSFLFRLQFGRVEKRIFASHGSGVQRTKLQVDESLRKRNMLRAVSFRGVMNSIGRIVSQA